MRAYIKDYWLCFEDADGRGIYAECIYEMSEEEIWEIVIDFMEEEN